MDVFLYHYDGETGEFLSVSNAKPAPIQPEPGPPEYIVPANATLQAPPDVPQNKAAIFSNDDGWSLVDDYRGLVYWLPDRSKHEIEELGIAPPQNAMLSEPAKTVGELKSEKEKELSLDCRTAITGGVDCAALGNMHRYPTQNSPEAPDQANLTATYTRAVLHGEAGAPHVITCCDGAGVWDARPHTAAQVIQVGDTVYAHIVECRARLRARLAALNAATVTTADQVAAITW
ncbi:hypothetical protein [Methylogaea oryzae]|uniref:DUF4376 domain-containing protein n=1 Tax=Methylogaea oryzae TaxID=1295382 RepID=A0A8D5AJR3_9GAMM|nr:hypothetical protein [Methylogaea oryzae]BBL70321.1 hypothetical protein MoryE10_09270 [Methylogaea oryzae]